MTACTRCQGTGFLNIEQIDDLSVVDKGVDAIREWIATEERENDVQVCDCCADEYGNYHGTPGYHYGTTDPSGYFGPYAYNGGFCECH